MTGRILVLSDDIKWLHGFFSGEGCAYVRQSRTRTGEPTAAVRAEVSFTQVDKRLLDRTQDILEKLEIFADIRQVRRQSTGTAHYALRIFDRYDIVQLHTAFKMVVPWYGKSAKDRQLSSIVDMLSERPEVRTPDGTANVISTIRREALSGSELFVLTSPACRRYSS